MDDITLLSQTPSAPNEASLPLTSLYEALQELPDALRTQGKRYSLALVLCLLVLAKLAGQKSLSGVTQWLRHRRVTLAERFAVRAPHRPCHMTYCNVFAQVDAVQLDTIRSALGRTKPLWRRTQSVVDAARPRRSFASGN